MTTSVFTSSVIPVIGVIDTYCEIDINFNISLILIIFIMRF